MIERVIGIVKDFEFFSIVIICMILVINQILVVLLEVVIGMTFSLFPPVNKGIVFSIMTKNLENEFSIVVLYVIPKIIISIYKTKKIIVFSATVPLICTIGVIINRLHKLSSTMIRWPR